MVNGRVDCYLRMEGGARGAFADPGGQNRLVATGGIVFRQVLASLVIPKEPRLSTGLNCSQDCSL
jgi:hypothetical protein